MHFPSLPVVIAACYTFCVTVDGLHLKKRSNPAVVSLPFDLTHTPSDDKERPQKRASKTYREVISNEVSICLLACFGGEHEG